MPGSFLLDVTPMGVQQAGQGAVAGIAQPIVHTSKGTAGFVLIVPNGSSPVQVARCVLSCSVFCASYGTVSKHAPLRLQLISSSGLCLAVRSQTNAGLHVTSS